MTEIRIGDVVRVTARVESLRGDGSYTLKPLGFDFDLNDRYDEWDKSKYEDLLGDLIVYTVDEPEFVRHVWVKGDRLRSPSGAPFIYHQPMGDGSHMVHLQDDTAAPEERWTCVSTETLEGWELEEPPQN